MQHHTGQHILTQAFVQVANANTVSFHLSDASVTIDLDVASVAPETLWKVEDVANRIVWENHPVTARLVKPDDTEGVRMRKLPDHILTDGLRVIDIDGFDVTACGGTHVGHTGEIGLIKILKVERRGEKSRVEFRCGGRALADYRDKNNVLTHVAGSFNARYDEVDQAIDRLREDLKQAERALKATGEQLVEYEAEHLLNNSAAERNGFRLIKAAFENRDAGEIRMLASRITQSAGIIALLGASGEKAQIILARSAGLKQDLNPALKRALPLLGNARGGGQPGFTQGGGVKANLAQVQAALDEAEKTIEGN
jgi:alanyl-tRNA synthetase